MKRALLFLLAAPALITATTTLLFVKAGGSGAGGFAAQFALAAFIFTFVVSALACGMDSYMASDLTRYHSIASRAVRTAVGGAVVAGGLTSLMIGCVLPPAAIVIAAIGGAVCMGICSLVASYYGDCQQASVPAGA